MSDKLHNFEYDSFQKMAIDAVDNESSVLVSAPTGAGKTVIADYVIFIPLPSKLSAIKNTGSSLKFMVIKLA